MANATKYKVEATTIAHQQFITVTALELLTSSKVYRKRHGSLLPTVVGGAPRDWDYGIPAQDIDIWCKNITFGDEHLTLLKDLFEPRGAKVGKVTNNTYSREGEYIHYIFNVLWEGVDLQFIFVQNPSVKSVIDHVCCNFSEISWDWKARKLIPTYKYKCGRMSKLLTFSDDAGRSPRDNYIAKMAKRYPDHKILLPDSCEHLKTTYEKQGRLYDSLYPIVTPDGTWGVQGVSSDFYAKLVKADERSQWVVYTGGDKGLLKKSRPYKILEEEEDATLRVHANDGEDILRIKACNYRRLREKELVVRCVETPWDFAARKGLPYVTTLHSSTYFNLLAVAYPVRRSCFKVIA